MAGTTVSGAHGAARVSGLLDSPEIAEFITTLESTKETGRPGYPVRSLIGLALVKAVYALPTWTRTCRLVAEHAGLQSVLGAAPSVSAAYRFSVKLRAHESVLTACVESVLSGLREHRAGFGDVVAIDGSDLPAWGNGQRYLYKGGPERQSYSDPNASWGHRSSVSTRSSGAYYGYKIHLAACTTTGLPVAWEIRTASAPEVAEVGGLLDTARARGFTTGIAIMDKGYDGEGTHATCAARDVRPVIAVKKTPGVVAGKHLPPECSHGTWIFAGADAKRQATKWRCPTGDCAPASKWIKADRLHPLIPLGSERRKALYRTRGAVERAFGNLKVHYGLNQLRVRGLARVRVHAATTILCQLVTALLNARTATPT